MPQPQPRQQSRLNDIQMLQRQMMFKKLQELQRQQQFQELNDTRLPNYINMNQQSMINKQVSGDQYPPLINGTPIHDASQRFMAGNLNFFQGASLVQGFSNGMGFPQAQSQAMRSMGLMSPQFDASLYGTPVSSVGNNMTQYSQLLGVSHDSVDVFGKGNNNQEEKPIMQPTAFSNSLRSDHGDASSNQVCMQGGTFKEKNLFGQIPTQSSNTEVLGGNFQQVNTLQRYTADMELGRRQEQTGWHGHVAEKVTNIGPSQDLCTLDPLEQKILFNMDDNSWGNVNSGLLQDSIENTDHLSTFPSVQSGSWSALMQSAVAETSSSDAGLQEEWSGLSFQNADHSTDNQPSNFMDSGKHNSTWIGNNLMSSSSLSKAVQFNSSNMSSTFPGFQHPDIQFPLKQKEGMHMESSSHELSQHQSPKNNSKWLDGSPQQKQITEGSPAVQNHSPLQNDWPGHSYEHSKTDAHQRSTSSYTLGTQEGNITGAAHKEASNMRKAGDNCEAGSYSNSFGGSEQIRSVADERIEYMGNSQHHQSNSPRICVNAFKGEGGTYEKQERIQRENSTDSYHSNTSQHTPPGHNLRENVWLRKSESVNAESNQRPSSQGLGQQSQGACSYELGYAEQFKLNDNVSNSSLDLEKGNLPDLQRNLTDEVSLRINAGSSWQASNSSKYMTSSLRGGNLTVQTSLELLHKVDNSNDYRLGMHLGSNDSTSISEVPRTENPDVFSAQLHNKPSPSQSFGLRLSPPSQRVPNSNCFDSSQSSPQMGNSSGTGLSGPSLLRKQLQNQHHLSTPVACQAQDVALPGLVSSQDTSHLISMSPCSQQLPILEANPVTQPFVMSGMSQQAAFPTMWTNAPAQQNQSGTEPRKVPFSFLPSPDSTNSGLDNASTAQQELNNGTYLKGHKETNAASLHSEGLHFLGEQAGKEASSQRMSFGPLNPVSQKGKVAYDQESLTKSLLQKAAYASSSLGTNSQHQGFDSEGHNDNQSRKISDIEVFGRSLKPANVPSQNYSLLHQVHSMKNVEDNRSKGVLANKSGVDELKPMSQTNLTSLGNIQHLPSDMSGNQSFKSLSQPLLQDTNQTSMFIHNDSHGLSDANQNSHISMQMAPSWFKHYGTLKNGQMLPMFDPRAGHQFNPGKMFENFRMNSSVLQINSSDTGQASSVWPTIANNSLAVQHPPYILPPDVPAKIVEVCRPKKRKVAAFQHLPWHKELTQDPERLLDCSLSDVEWARAATRLIEKVDGETATIEDAPNLRPKKRLALTTKLMQHVFRPAPPVILSGDATSSCDTVVHFAARLTLGDACSLSSLQKPMDSSDMSKPKTHERVGDKESAKLVKNFIDRSKTLEANFLSLDKSASISDLRVEAQELDKFSVITRLAKFHSRGQAASAEASTSAGVPRPFLHKYVSAAPMPRTMTIPEGDQCISL